jgi:hypothetical protein
MSVRGLPTRNTSIVMLAWAPRSEVSSWSWLGVDPFSRRASQTEAEARTFVWRRR